MQRTPAFRRQMTAAVMILLVFGAAAAFMMPWIKTLYDPALRDGFTAFVASLGIWGYLLMLGVQVVQVVVALIPGEPVELIAGALYGGPGGLALCIAGCVAGSALIFLLMRSLGSGLTDRLYRNKKLREYDFLRDSRKLDSVVLLLFMLPGTPKDLLTYAAGATRMPVMRFIVISSFARIPSVATSTFIGDSVLDGNWYAALALLLFTLALGLAGIFLREKVMNFCRRFSRRRAGRVDSGDGV